jgi:hypothetical protein
MPSHRLPPNAGWVTFAVLVGAEICSVHLTLLPKPDAAERPASAEQLNPLQNRALTRPSRPRPPATTCRSAAAFGRCIGEEQPRARVRSILHTDAVGRERMSVF